MSVLKCPSGNFSQCQHAMFPRCPGCRVEVYGPAVWGFSHGEFPCNCGHHIIPRDSQEENVIDD